MLEEQGIRIDTGEDVVRIDPCIFRPAQVESLLGDPSKVKEKLGWTSTKTIQELVTEMLAADMKEAKKEVLLRN